MRKIPILIVLICSNVFIANSHKAKVSVTKNKPEPVARWKGTIKWDAKTTYSNFVQEGTEESHAEVFFTVALPTMNREDGSTGLNFTDDKGTGSFTIHSDITSYPQTIVKKRCVTDCSGSVGAELHTVIVREWDNTYDIEVITPVCHGTDCEGKAFQDQIMITVSNETFTNKDVLTGTRTRTGELPAGFGTFTNTTTWHFERVKEDNDPELIVTPVEYDTWLPEPGKNELNKGNVLTINLKLQGKNGKPLKVKAESFELHLKNTSKEKGITINYPLVPNKDQLPDLRFIQRIDIESIKADQTITVGSPDGKTGKAFLASYDGGGWTELTVEAILDDKKRRIKGNLLKPGGETEILIPKRDPKSKIGEFWLKKYGNPGETDDNDYSNGNKNDGDGLSVYEEYRGVISEAQFSKTNPNNFGRLDPNKKDLGVKVKKAELSLFEEGIKLMENAAFINVIRFTEREIGQDRRLNNNQGSFNIYKQYTEQLEKGSLAGDAIGENQPATITAKTPKTSEHVVIDIDKIKKNYADQLSVVQNAIRNGIKNISMPYTESEQIASTVAHELAHGMNVNHHGLPSNEPDKTIPLTSVDIYHVYDPSGGEITEQFRGQTISGIGIQRNDESGNLSCIMAYTGLYNWVHIVGQDGSLNYYKVPLLPVGKIMCKEKAGKGINYNNQYFGDAANDFGNYVFGNCLSQIKLKD